MIINHGGNYGNVVRIFAILFLVPIKPRKMLVLYLFFKGKRKTIINKLTYDIYNNNNLYVKGYLKHKNEIYHSIYLYKRFN